MHERIIMLLDAYHFEGKQKHKKRIKTYKDSFKARSAAINWLNESGFADSEKRFSGARADWFVIGGRWSGNLTKMRYHPLLYKACIDKIQKKKWSDAKAEKIWKEFFPKDKISPWKEFKSRDPYNFMGAEDDAQIVDDKLWAHLIRDLIASSSDDIYSDPILCDGLVSLLKKREVVGKMWAVVIDAHM